MAAGLKKRKPKKALANSSFVAPAISVPQARPRRGAVEGEEGEEGDRPFFGLAR